MPRQDGAQLLAEARQRLVQRHAGAAGIGENDFDAMIDQALHQNIGPGLQDGILFAHGEKTS